MGLEDCLCHAAALKEGQAEQDCISHTGPDGGNRILVGGDVLHQDRVDCHAYHDKERLKTQLNAANEHIDTLTCQVDSLNTTIFSVNERLAATQGTATRLENELNTCYYIIASKSVLKESKILETGFLRKSKLLKGDFDKGLFVTCDKRYADSLDLQSDKARILTNHSEGSYEIVEQNGKKILHITSPEQFWDCSNYLVVQID